MLVSKWLQLCPTLCDPMDYSPPGPSIHGDSPGKNTWLPCPPPGDLPNPGIEPMCLISPALGGRFLPLAPASIYGNIYIWEAPYIHIPVPIFKLTLFY